jgi:hypothetical protein
LSVLALAITVSLLGFSHWKSERAPVGIAAPAPSPAESPRGSSLDATAESAARRQDTAAASAQVASWTLGLSGIVLDAQSHSAVPGVEIEASVAPLPSETRTTAKTTSDAQGHYTLTLGIPADLAWDPNVWAVQLDASGDRFQSVFRNLHPSDFLPDGKNPGVFVATHDIEVKLMLALSGRLVRESDRSPIAHGMATLLSSADSASLPQSIASAKTDEAGRFIVRLETAAPGGLAVLGSASGFLAKIVPVALDPMRSIDIGDMALGEGSCLEGIVTTADGSAPVATQVVAQTRAQGDAWMFLQQGSWALRNDVLVPRDARATIGPDGRFRLCGLVPDEYFLSLSFPGCRTGSSLDSLEARAPATNLRIQVLAAVYRLRVLDAQSGNALDRAQFIFDGPSGMPCWIEGKSVVATDPAIESPGRIVAEGYRELKCTLPALAASEVRELEFRLEPLPPQFVPTIIVTSPSGDPVQDVEIDILGDATGVGGPSPLSRFAHAAKDGRHVLPKLAPGTYHLVVEPRRDGAPSAEMWLGSSLELRVREGMEPIQVQLGEGGLVQAAAKKADGGAVDVRTSLVQTEPSTPEPLDWRSGTSHFPGWIPKQTTVRLAKPLPVGRWTMRFEADGCTSKEVPVDIERGQVSTIEVSLEPKKPG